METGNFFVGREKVIEILNTFAEQAFNNRQGMVVGIAGPGGVGKSSLVRFFLEATKELYRPEVLVGRCLDTDAMPFPPFTEALRRYFKISGVDQLIILRLYINHEEMLTPAKLLHLHKRRKRISTV